MGSVCPFSLGTTDAYMKAGEQKERTEWHNVVFFGKLAEIAENTSSKDQAPMCKGTSRPKSGKIRTGLRSR